jgi:glycerol-3-phosphate dehydrogenase (NAD(P)+)
MKKIAVIGAGAWGTAIANHLANNNHKVTLWCFEEEVVADINNYYENKIFLPNIALNKNITATNNFVDLKDNHAVFSVIPAQFTKITLQPLINQDILTTNTPLVICSKGIENSSLNLLSNIFQETFPKHPIAVMSGPNFADEIALGKKAITTIACSDKKQAEFIANIVSNKNFTPLLCDDIIGTQLGGAIKNVIAIALGVANGLALSESLKSALITKGLNEIYLLSEALGGKKITAIEPCGVGDLVLTCSSLKSRNMSLGYKLGQGQKLAEIMQGSKNVVEGVATTKAAWQLAHKLNLKLPLISLIYDILYNNKPVDKNIF